MPWRLEEENTDYLSGNVTSLGAEIKCIKGFTVDNQVNAILLPEEPKGKDNENILEQGKYQWKFHILNGGGMGIGLTEESRFKSGYGLEALMYGGEGNLSNGSSLTTMGWGPEFHQGDNIGMQLQVINRRVIISFSHNGHGLGPAFDIDDYDGGAPCPVVSFTNANQAILVSPSNESSFDADARFPWYYSEGIEGRWKGRDFGCHITANGTDTWTMSCRFVNITCFSIKKIGNGYSVQGWGISTAMGMDPASWEKEQSGLKFLSEVTNISREDDKLRLTSPERSELLLVVPAQGPATISRWRVK